MSVTRLYLGKSLSDLNNLAEVKVDRSTHPRNYCKTATRVYEKAAENSVKGDEEKAFVLYMRYCSIITQLKKGAKYKKHQGECDKILLGTNVAIAVAEAERLANSLSKRYEALNGTRTDCDDAKDENGDDSDTIKLPSVPSWPLKGPNVSASITSSSDVYELLQVGPTSVLEPKKVGQNEGNVIGMVRDDFSQHGMASSACITPPELFDLLKTNAKVLILDTRSAESFTASCITKGDLVNIPEDLLVAGIGPGIILMNLKPQFRDLWSNRKHADHVILVDYDTTAETFYKHPTLPIGNLKEAIYKYDSQVTLKTEPRILEGGFQNWILHYPTFVTDSSWKREEVKTKAVGAVAEESLDYPELPGEKKDKKREDAKRQAPQQPLPQSNKPDLLPVIPDRSKKPQQNNLNANSQFPAGEAAGNGHSKPAESQPSALQRPELPLNNKFQPAPQPLTLPPSQPTHNLPQPSTNLPPAPPFGSNASYPLVVPSSTPTPPNTSVQPCDNSSHVEPRGISSHARPHADLSSIQPHNTPNSYSQDGSRNAVISRVPDHPNPPKNNSNLSVNVGNPHSNPSALSPPQQPVIQIPTNPVACPDIPAPQSTQPTPNQMPISLPKLKEKILPDITDQPKPLNNRNSQDTVVAVDPRVPAGEMRNLLVKPAGNQSQEEKYNVGKMDEQHPGDQRRSNDMNVPGSQPVVPTSDSSVMCPPVLPLPQQRTVQAAVLPEKEVNDSQPANIPSVERPDCPPPSVERSGLPPPVSVVPKEQPSSAPDAPPSSVIPPQQQTSQPAGGPSKQDTPQSQPQHSHAQPATPNIPESERRASASPPKPPNGHRGRSENNAEVQARNVSQPQGPNSMPHGTPHGTHITPPHATPNGASIVNPSGPVGSGQTKPQLNAPAAHGSYSHGGVQAGYGPVRPQDQRGTAVRQMPQAHVQPATPFHPVFQRPVQSRVPQPHWLPYGWERCFDDRTGRYYFKDHTTKSTHWELPQAVLQQLAADQSRTQPQPQPVASRERSISEPRLEKQHVERPTVDRGRKPQLEAVQPMPTIDRSSKPQAYRPPNRKRDFAPVFGSVGRALTGLRNLGNTCFMNSIVQCLNATTPLSSYFISGTYIKDVNLDNPLGMKGEIAEEFGFVIKSLWSGQYRSIAPYDFKLTISQFAPQFSGSQQQDSQELMAFLLDGLHEDLNRVIVKSYVEEKDTTSIPDVQAAQISWTNHLKRNNSIIVDMFQGQFRNTMICLSCRKQSVTFQAFMYLSLPLPSSHRCSLTDCLEFFRRREKVSGEDKWYCPHCKQLREASKQLEIWKLPRILLIHLKRFSFKGLWRQKLNTDVSFPISALNVNNYVAGPDMPGNYDLYAVSNHTGDLNGGHYTAYCRNPFNRKWYTFDDKDVSEKSESGVRSRAAYILFYTSIDFRPPRSI